MSSTYDYVCDVQWSPTHPALFCTVSSGGTLTLWDLSKSILEPQDSIDILAEDDSKGSQGAAASASPSPSPGCIAALNKLTWAGDGLRVYVGDTAGTVHIVLVKETCTRARQGDERYIIHPPLHLPLAAAVIAVLPLHVHVTVSRIA